MISSLTETHMEVVKYGTEVGTEVLSWHLHRVSALVISTLT